jgi:hypothetical protein
MKKAAAEARFLARDEPAELQVAKTEGKPRVVRKSGR